MPNVRSVALSLLGAGLVAQSNPFVVFPQDPQRQGVTAASYVGRPDWNRQAEGFQEIGDAWFRGVGLGGSGASCIVDGFYHWAADENGSTPEVYGIVLRDSVGGMIDPTPAGEILRIQNLSTPLGAATRTSFIMTDVFATPVTVPCDRTWFQGIDMPANPAWPATDGHALWRADMPGISPATVGENPRASAPRVTWALPVGGTPFQTGWTYILGVTAPTPMLHLGGIDPTSTRTGGVAGEPSYGMSGLFPDITGAPRADGLNLRIQDSARPNGIALAVIGLGYFQFALPFPPFTGALLLDPSVQATAGFAPMVGGAGTMPIAMPGAVPPALVGATFLFQGLVVDPATGGGAFTNTQAVVF